MAISLRLAAPPGDDEILDLSKRNLAFQSSEALRGSPVTPAVVNALLHESELGVVFERLVPGRPEDYTATFEEGTRELFRRVGTVATTGAHSP
jgi:hypothetical protein